MNTVIQSRCRVYCTKTMKIVSRFHKHMSCFPLVNDAPVFLQNSTESKRCLFQITKVNSVYGMALRRNTQSMAESVSNVMQIMKQCNQQFSSGKVMQKPLNEADVKKSIDALTDKFMEARELLSDARESEGTVYFSDDMEEAQQAVKETVEEYSQLLSKLSEQQRQDVVRAVGLKMEELKAQLQAMEEELKEDH